MTSPARHLFCFTVCVVAGLCRPRCRPSIDDDVVPANWSATGASSTLRFQRRIAAGQGLHFDEGRVGGRRSFCSAI